MIKSSAVQNYAIAGIADVLSCFGVPTGAAMQIYQDILAKRAQEAMEILLSEIRQGNFSNVDQNDAVSIIARFQRDAMEGVARKNLRLLARMINGMAENDELNAPSFARYANILSSLTTKEIRILSVIAQFKSKSMSATWGAERHDALLSITAQAEGHLQALLRTGLINMHIAIVGFPTQKYEPTKLMDEILNYVGTFPEEKNL